MHSRVQEWQSGVEIEVMSWISLSTCLVRSQNATIQGTPTPLWTCRILGTPEDLSKLKSLVIPKHLIFGCMTDVYFPAFGRMERKQHSACAIASPTNNTSNQPSVYSSRRLRETVSLTFRSGDEELFRPQQSIMRSPNLDATQPAPYEECRWATSMGTTYTRLFGYHWKGI